MGMDAIRVVHVIAGLDPAHGGPSYSVPRLCAALAETGADVSLLSVALQDKDANHQISTGYHARRFTWDFARVPMLGALRYSSGLVRALHQAAPKTELIHNH